MAQLYGVRTVSDLEIEYDGLRYEMVEGPAQVGDIARNDVGYNFMPWGTYYLLNEKLMLEVDDGDTFEFDADENVLFRRVSPQTPAEIRALIDAKKAEIAELETQLAEAERIGVGEYVRLTGRSDSGDFTAGDIAQVADEDRSEVPYKLWSIVGNSYDWVRADRVVKITPAEAKAALIAQVEEAFESAA